MAIVEKHPGKPPHLPSELLQLPHCFGADEDLLALSYGVPQTAAVFSHTSGQAVGVAVVLHLGDRAGRVQPY